jgi:hypothetical protein
MTTVDSARDSDERQVRLTEREALANVRTVLEQRKYFRDPTTLCWSPRMRNIASLRYSPATEYPS